MTLFLLFSCPEKIFCMENHDDFLIWSDSTYHIEYQEWPLEKYYKNKTKPLILYSDPDLGLKDYSAYWEIRNDSLFLRKVIINEHEVDLTLLFKGYEKKLGIFAQWYHGTIKISFGNPIIQHIVNEYGKDFLFNHGVQSTVLDYKYSITKRSKYSKDPKLLLQFIKENINYNISGINKEGMVIVAINNVSDSGKIEKVEVVRPLDDIRNKEAIRVVISIPEWDVLYRNGERYVIHDNIPIKFGMKK